MISSDSAGSISFKRPGNIRPSGAGMVTGTGSGVAIGAYVSKILSRSVCSVFIPTGRGGAFSVDTFVIHGLTASPIHGLLVRNLQNIPVGWILNFWGSLFFHDDIYILLDENGMHLQVKEGKYLGIMETGNDS